MKFLRRKSLLTEPPLPRTFHWRHPNFWIVILLLLTLGSIWGTFIKLISWLEVVATK
jgi:hypothetical protein